MEYEILIKKNELLYQVNLRTYYHAKGEKRKDLNADIGETSVEDEELMDLFITKTINELISEQIGRFENISFKTNEEYINLKFKSNNNINDESLSIMKQLLTDYLVNELMVQWLLIRQRSWSDSYISMRSELYKRIRELFAIFCNKKIRRRPTDLAGI